MIKDESKDLMELFFGAYFHQDWMIDSSTSSEVVKLYTENAKVEDMLTLASAINDYMSQSKFENGEDLENALSEDFGCFYRIIPEEDGTVRDWLKSIIEELLDAAEKK